MRVDHEKKRDGVRVDHEKKSDGVRVDHEKLSNNYCAQLVVKKYLTLAITFLSFTFQIFLLIERNLLILRSVLI